MAKQLTHEQPVIIDMYDMLKGKKGEPNPYGIEAMTRESDRMVKGKFINVETPGQPAKVNCKLYKGMPFFSKLFMDNEICTIPLSVARFINERCCNETHSNLLDDKGNPIKSSNFINRYRFASLEF